MQQVIYRIEHRTKRTGPYNAWYEVPGGADLWDKLFDYNFHSATRRHPSPTQEGGPCDPFVQFYFNTPTDDLRFGFASKAQLLAWFTRKELMFLFSTMRFVLRRYVVPGGAYAVTPTQAMFKLSQARRI